MIQGDITKTCDQTIMWGWKQRKDSKLVQEVEEIRGTDQMIVSNVGEAGV